jgi:hypothetical protein
MSMLALLVLFALPVFGVIAPQVFFQTLLLIIWLGCLVAICSGKNSNSAE